MVTSIVGAISQAQTRPYLSAAMFKLYRRRGVSAENLVPKGDPADQDAALLEYIAEASSWCDDIANQELGAALFTDQKTVNVDRWGYVTFAPPRRPILGVTAFSIGPTVDQLTDLTVLDGIDVQEGILKVPAFGSAMLTSSAGPIQFVPMTAPFDKAVCRYSIVHGYPVTTLTSDAAAGAATLAVADTTGIIAGQTWLTLHAGRARHRFLATSVSTADAGGIGTGPGTIGCAPVLPVAVTVSDPADPPMLSGMPGSLIYAIVLATQAMIKGGSGGGGGPVSSTGGKAGGQKNSARRAGDDFAEAERILRQYAVVTP